MLNVLKTALLLVCFVLTFFIITNMYRRLDKNLVDGISNFIPFILLFILFSINFIFKQKTVNNCFFFNLTCCLTLSMLGFAIFRTFCDKNMIVLIRLGYDINFNYFADIIAPMKVMLYVLCICDVGLMISDIDFNKLLKIEVVEEEPPKKKETSKVKETTKTKKKTTK